MTSEQQPVATYMGKRYTPEGTKEFWGWLSEDTDDLPPATKLYAAPPTTIPTAAVEALVEASERALTWLSSYPGGGALGCYDQLRAALAQPELAQIIKADRVESP